MKRYQQALSIILMLGLLKVGVSQGQIGAAIEEEAPADSLAQPTPHPAATPQAPAAPAAIKKPKVPKSPLTTVTPSATTPGTSAPTFSNTKRSRGSRSPADAAYDAVSDDLLDATRRSSYYVYSTGSKEQRAPVLVIPREATDAKVMSEIVEDLNIMSRIFEERLGQGGRARYYGTRFDLFGSSRSEIEGIYLEGYGVLFLIKVDFPLMATAEQKEETPDQAPTDPVWHEARESIYNPEAARQKSKYYRYQTKQMEYDAEKVAELKRTLTSSLRHANNIRHVQGGESIILVVQGKQEAPFQVTNYKIEEDGEATAIVRSLPLLGSAKMTTRSVLILRVEKSVVDRFAQGELSQEEFRKQVNVIRYQGAPAQEGETGMSGTTIQMKTSGDPMIPSTGRR